MNKLDQWLRGFSPTAKYEGEDMNAATPQPAPQPGRTEVYRHVIHDIQERVDAGERKYGTKLMTHNGRDALMDAYQEAIDLVMYLRQAMDERGVDPYPQGIAMNDLPHDSLVTHELKTWPEFFQAVVEGRKHFELRKNDRKFFVGDRLHLREYDPNTDLYTGRWCRVAVTYVMRDVQRWGLPADMCVMSIRPVEAQA